MTHTVICPAGILLHMQFVAEKLVLALGSLRVFKCFPPVFIITSTVLLHTHSLIHSFITDVT